jgi:hypothetical protein
MHAQIKVTEYLLENQEFNKGVPAIQFQFSPAYIIYIVPDRPN